MKVKEGFKKLLSNKVKRKTKFILQKLNRRVNEWVRLLDVQ